MIKNMKGLFFHKQQCCSDICASDQQVCPCKIRKSQRSHILNGKKNGLFRGMSENEHSIHIVCLVSVDTADRQKNMFPAFASLKKKVTAPTGFYNTGCMSSQYFLFPELLLNSQKDMIYKKNIKGITLCSFCEQISFSGPKILI